MSDDEEKRHDATPAKRRRARREGNVARSAELSSIAAFGAATLAAAIAVPLAAAAAATAVRHAADTAAATAVRYATSGGSEFQTVGGHDGSVAISGEAVTDLAVLAGAALVPVVAAAIAGSLTGVAQAGGLHVVAPHADLRRLDPVAGLKRMVGAEAFLAIVRGAIAFAAALVLVAPLMRDVVAAGIALGSPGATAALWSSGAVAALGSPDGAAAPGSPGATAALRSPAAVAVGAPGAVAAVVGFAALRACGTAFAVGAVFAVVEYALARRRWLRGLRMSFEELKRDAKENDGDPHARSRRKSAHRAVVRGSIGRAREASFVVVNPTHVAVALRYAPPAVPVPEILVRALDDAALRVRSIAAHHRIPIVEDVGLARLLYAQGENGLPIPPDAYVAVAHVVAALAREGVLT